MKVGINKARRHELKMLKYKRRLKLYGLKEAKYSNLFAYRSHGTPCSCYMCQQLDDNYNRAKQKMAVMQLISHEKEQKVL